MVTHLTTSPPVEGLTCGEQTGSSVYPSPVVVCGRNYKKYCNQCWSCNISDVEHVGESKLCQMESWEIVEEVG